VLRRCVRSSNLMNEEALTRLGFQRHRKKYIKAEVRVIKYITVKYKCYKLLFGLG